MGTSQNQIVFWWRCYREPEQVTRDLIATEESERASTVVERGALSFKHQMEMFRRFFLCSGWARHKEIQTFSPAQLASLLGYTGPSSETTKSSLILPYILLLLPSCGRGKHWININICPYLYVGEIIYPFWRCCLNSGQQCGGVLQGIHSKHCTWP